MYESPLATRYAGLKIQEIFSPLRRIQNWHLLWLNLAQAQKTLGLPISEKALTSLAKVVDQVPFAQAKQYEATFRHDVMAHLHALGDLCPEAKGFLHLGATSCYVTDNGDLMQYNEAMTHILGKLATLTEQLTHFAQQHHSLVCLAYTHYQAAQPTTVGKRACLWLQDLLTDAASLAHFQDHLQYLGVKGATGSQSSFLTLFAGDIEKVARLETTLQELMQWKHVFPISGQTYSRKQDASLLFHLSQIAISCHKMATDLRLLAHDGEITEARLTTQVGSSAMPHKVNPIIAERICSLARFVMSLEQNAVQTAAHQWLERTLDDSANRRLVIPEAFLATDAILNLMIHLSASLQVHPETIQRNLARQIPYLITEVLLMKAVEKGASRQHAHEVLRQACAQAAHLSLEQWLDSLAHIPDLRLSRAEITEATHLQTLAGLASYQTLQFLQTTKQTKNRQKIAGDPISV